MLKTFSGGAFSVKDSIAQIYEKTVNAKIELDPVGQEDDDVDNDGDSDSSDKYLKNRRKAVAKAMKESEDMTDREVDNREKIADRLMKKKADFKKRYGDKWEDVLYATATKLAMSGDTGDEEND